MNVEIFNWLMLVILVWIFVNLALFIYWSFYSLIKGKKYLKYVKKRFLFIIYGLILLIFNFLVQSVFSREVVN